MSFSETIFLFFLALIVFGPKKLPEIARQAGKLLAELRRASNEFKSQIEQEISHLETENNQKALPPLDAPYGSVTSRSLNAAGPADLPATQAGPAESPDTKLGSSENPSAPPATEAAAGAAPDSVPAPASQEFHA